MRTRSDSTLTSGYRLFAWSVVAVVLLASAAIGLLQATSDGTGGDALWSTVGVIAVTIARGVVVVAVSNLIRHRHEVVSTAAVLVASVPLVGIAIFLAPTWG
ncbi:membrane protein YdbS with pleckstrin-like domain [Leifsonia sp. AK011]|uniref:hypothetical protein n=1 Tax=Leifsonia sp. AK011 TaxID=2723075 RepID=UPI0015CE185D|nr:hypothetical protein [Leifsonia sp. AK011]NYF11267.1 membrane protein YdbS with pleckstrin-like domain [Leifsonia sp. AK011]